MSYRSNIERLSKLSSSDVNRQLRRLLVNCPTDNWPFGMPGSLDPKLVLIGVSPGNSPDLNRGSEELVSTPGSVPPNNFYYKDSASYWEKVRSLSHQFVSRSDKSIDEASALLVTSHFNLGTSGTGTASKSDVEKSYITWVSQLLNRELEPDLIVLFGLVAIMNNKEVREWWNHSDGLLVNWSKPQREIPFTAYKESRWKYREWSLTSKRGHDLRIVMWPNHPSRPPVKDPRLWDASVKEYIAHYESSA